MAYNPVSGAAIQYVTSAGNVASGYYLKFYTANTTTPLSMATDATGDTLLAKCKLNDKGYPISNDSDNTTVFIPHVNASYRFVLYTNSTDADANTTANADVNIPSIAAMVGTELIGTDSDQIPLNSDLGTASLAAVTTSATDTTTGSVLRVDDAYDSSSLNYHTTNLQVTTTGGLNVVRVMMNISGGTHNDGDTGIAGSDVGFLVWGTDGSTVSRGAASGTWTCLGGGIVSNGQGGTYVRTA